MEVHKFIAPKLKGLELKKAEAGKGLLPPRSLLPKLAYPTILKRNIGKWAIARGSEIRSFTS
jgi:hypothetical protein